MYKRSQVAEQKLWERPRVTEKAFSNPFLEFEGLASKDDCAVLVSSADVKRFGSPLRVFRHSAEAYVPDQARLMPLSLTVGGKKIPLNQVCLIDPKVQQIPPRRRPIPPEPRRPPPPPPRISRSSTSVPPPPAPRRRFAIPPPPPGSPSRSSSSSGSESLPSSSLSSISAPPPPPLTPEEREAKHGVPSKSLPYSFPERQRIPGVQLGSGAFGVVREIKLPTGETIAEKEIKNARHLSPDILREIYALGAIPIHPNLSHLLDVDIKEDQKSKTDRVRLALEKARFGTLSQHLWQVSSLTPIQVLALLQEIFCGLAYMHSMGFYHMDIKPGNILVYAWPENRTDIPFLRLSDLGLIQWRDVVIPLNPVRGTEEYTPPEYACLANDAGEYLNDYPRYRPTAAGDLWSAGVTLLIVVASYIWQERARGAWVSRKKPVESAQNYFHKYSYEPSSVWQEVHCWEQDNPLKNRRRGGRTRPPAKQELIAWLRERLRFEKFPEVKQPLSSIEQKRRQQQPWILALVQLGTELLSFDPRKRPSAKQVVQRIDGIARTLGSSGTRMPPCQTIELSPELLFLNRIGERKENKGRDNLSWITDSKIRTQVRTLYDQILHFATTVGVNAYEEIVHHPRDQKFAQEAKSKLDALVDAVRAVFFHSAGQLTPSDIPALFLWLSSFLLAGPLDRTVAQNLQEWEKKANIDVTPTISKLVRERRRI